MNYKSISELLPFLIILLCPTFAFADGWALFSEQAQMREHVIVDVGEVSKVNPSQITRRDNDVYKMNGRCFSFNGYNGQWNYGSKAAFLLANAQNSIKLALIESSIGSLKVEMKSLTMLECPSAEIIPYSLP